MLAEARRAGYASEDGEVTSGFASVAAAVHDHSGHPVAAVALTFETDDMNGVDGSAPGIARAELARAVVRAAATITRRLSGSTGSAVMGRT